MTYLTLLDLQSVSRRQAASSKLSGDWKEPLATLMEQDRDFFLQHPEQEYYVRPVAPVEIIEGQAMGRAIAIEEYVLVGEIAPGFRVRLPAGDGWSSLPIKEFKAAQQKIRKEMGIKSPEPKDQLKHRGNAHKRTKPKGFG